MSNQQGYWEKLIKKQTSSGITATRFCAEHRIGIHKFKYWQKKLKLEQVPGKFMQVYPEIGK